MTKADQSLSLCIRQLLVECRTLLVSGSDSTVENISHFCVKKACNANTFAVGQCMESMVTYK